jgi:4-hydroxy-tetrahydrodipicolinate reductase
MAPAAFRKMLRNGTAGHAGLRESLALLAHCMGWSIDRITERANVVVASRRIRTRYFEVQKGEACGLHQSAKAVVGGKVRVALDLKMYLGAPDPHDRIIISGDPPLDVVLKGGVAGDQATVAALVNAAPRLMQAQPGLLLATDLPISHQK